MTCSPLTEEEKAQRCALMNARNAAASGAAVELEAAERDLLAHVHDSTAKTIELIGKCAAAELRLREANAEKLRGAD